MKTAANATSRNRDGVTVERGAQSGRTATKRPEADEDDAQDELEDRAGLHSCRMKWSRKYCEETTGTASGSSSRIHRVGHRPRIAVPARICSVPNAQPV